jgi:zinc transport system substrate-binding protein
MMNRAALFTVSLALLAACEQSPPAPSPSAPSTPPAAATPAPPPAPPRPGVVATFYPLYDFTRNVAGERLEVSSLVPAGVEPHDWEPTPQDIADLRRAKALVFNGAGFEPWIDKMVGELRAASVLLVSATEGLPLVRTRGRADEPDHGAKHGKDAHGHKGEKPGGAQDDATEDPHVWLDPVLAQRQVELIRDGLAKADPEGAPQYAENARTYTARLAALDQAFQDGLKTCARRDIVVSHGAFGYLARRYKLTTIPVTGVSPEAEPTPSELASITRLARQRKVKYIFFETLVNQRLAETLAREVGAKTLVLNPVEGLTKEEEGAGKDYVRLMEENLKNLRTALDCK